MLPAAALPHPPRATLLRSAAGILPAVAAFLGCFLLSAPAAETPEAGMQMLQKGKYAEALQAAETALAEPDWNREEWHVIQLRSLLTTGRYPEALEALEKALEHTPRSLRVQWLGREIYLANGMTDEAGDVPREIERLMGWLEGAYRDAPSITIFGKALLRQGTDPKTVLDRVFAPAQKLDPKAPEPLLARGELALEKNDFALAAKTFQNALKLFPDDADFHCGLALAFAPSDRKQMLASLESALEFNPKHIPALLRLAEHRIDAEEYEAAAALLDQIHAINPNRPEMWALRAVLAHLKHDPAAEIEARNNGLKFWTTNPLVDHLTGKKLSQKYRFAEGATRQRRALVFDPDYLPAKAQLASDLLRLGEEEEGWKLAAAVHELDAYDTATFNLMTLHDAMQKKFTTLQNENFTVRMDAAEAKIYGPRVLELLGEARQKLGAKYGLEIDRPVIVEIFPKQKDFGVRTFGMPDNPGYLGVCFGRVVTATSPAARPGTAINWESVLWHEFCHTVTLQATQNKMPRWLSEGISVYEERQADPSWGERMIPEYREMILTGELTPVSKLSGAFLSPKSPLHLQFAYFEASLVVEFLIERHGLETLKTILAELRDGTPLNDSLARRTAPLEDLERDFAAHAEKLAHEMSPGLDWEKPAPELLLPDSAAELAKWTESRPDNFHVLMRQAVSALENKQPAEARAPLERIVSLYPQQTGPDSARVLLARVHRELGETDAERTVLTRFAETDDEAPEAYLRLMELASAAGDWPAVEKQARRYLAVNPLIPQPWNFLAEAAEKSGNAPRATEALQTLLNLDPPNPAALHWRLARILHHGGNPEERRHLLLALEEAPRHRAALRLLLEMNRHSPATPPEPVTVPPPDPGAAPLPAAAN